MGESETFLVRHLRLLRQFIAASGCSHREIERRLGWERGSLERVLADPESPRYDHLLAILETIGIEARELFAALAAEPDPPVKT